jgi:hypothetical protein
LAALPAKCADAEGRLGRLYAAIENGVAGFNDAKLKAVSMPLKPSAISPGSLRTLGIRNAARHENNREQDRGIYQRNAGQCSERRNIMYRSMRPKHNR